MMDNNKPLIIVSNDDGYDANGIHTLVDAIKTEAEVIVCAPDGPRSGYSRAFSAASPLYLTRRYNMEGVNVWSCNGTPVDCVKLADSELCNNRRPTLIVSGVNHGDNSTVNCHYSGTMGVAVEGCLKHIPSIAFSSCDYNPEADLSHLKPYIQSIVRKVLQEGLPHNICLNVNFPTGKTYKGVKACRMARGLWVNEVEKQLHPRGYSFYWLVGHYHNEEPDDSATDQWALRNGYVAITPTTIDVTAHNFIDTVNGWNLTPTP